MADLNNNYTTTVNGNEVSFNQDFLQDYIISEKYLELFENNNLNFTNLTKSQFAKVLENYINDKNPHNYIGSYQFGLSALKKLNKALLINFFTINEPHLSNDFYSNKIKIHPELQKEVLRDLPNLSKQELAIYIYIKLCYLLRYDEQFDAVGQKGRIAKMHEDYNFANTITPTNNAIVCYEFVFLYCKFLQQLDIDYLINSRNPKDYGMRHTSVTLKIGNYTVLADPTKQLFKDDLMQAKINTPLQGINCIDVCEKDKKGFSNLVNKIYKLYQEKNVNKYCPQNNTNYWIEKIEEAKDSDTLDINEKWQMLKHSIKEITLPQTEKLALANTIITNLFSTELQNKQLCVSYFCKNLPNKKYSTAIGMAYNNDIDGVTHPFLCNYNKYIVYDGKTLKFYTKDDLQQLFDDGAFNYIRKRCEGNTENANYEGRLPGIFENYPVPEKE